MAQYCAASIQQNGTGLSSGRNIGKRASFAEKSRLFSAAARILVSDLLCGDVEIQHHDIRLDIPTEKGGAIFISERVSKNPDFQRMWAETSCCAMLKTLALQTLER